VILANRERCNMEKGGLFLSIDNLAGLNSSSPDLLVIELIKTAIIFELAEITEISEFIVGYAKGIKESNNLNNNVEVVSIGNGLWELLLNKSTPLCSSISLDQAEAAKLLAMRVFNL